MAGKYKVPKPIQDEDLWIKYFTKTQLLALVVATTVGFGIIRLTYRIHLVMIGVILAILLIIATLLATMAVMPKEKYLFGGGCTIWRIGYRIIRRKLFPSNKVIYTSTQEDESENPFG